jgi:hypothetical protein
MKINLLKINAMKRFAKWLDIKHVHSSLWGEWFYYDRVFLGLDKREKQANERDNFCRTRCTQRSSWKETYSKLGQSTMSYKLLKYIIKRKNRS